MENKKKRAERNDAKRASEMKYQREKTKMISLKFYPTDMELYEYACKMGKQSYIKSLIRKDMEG